MTVHYEKRGHVRVVTIDRPESRNALDAATTLRLKDIWEEFRDDEDAWVGVLTGAGDRAFCAGADLKEIDPAARAAGVTPPPRGIITRDFTCYKPLIAALNGSAFGGGLEMALACDLRVASADAKLALTESRLGLLPGAGGTQRLPRQIPPAIALEMLFTGEPLTAQRAYEVGLVNRVVPADQVMTAALELADRIAKNGPVAVRSAKEAAQRGADVPLAEGLRIEQNLSRHVFGTEDAKEGPLAFKEKRDPVYQAR
jgi:enoyl-CoA hydratase/carnithine racemase